GQIEETGCREGPGPVEGDSSAPRQEAGNIPISADRRCTGGCSIGRECEIPTRRDGGTTPGQAAAPSYASVYGHCPRPRGEKRTGSVDDQIPVHLEVVGPEAQR